MCVVSSRLALKNQDSLVEKRDKYGASDVNPGFTSWAQINKCDTFESLGKRKLDGIGNYHIRDFGFGEVIMELVPFKEKLWLSSPTMHGDELTYMREAYETNWMTTLGKNIDEVERLICEKTGIKYAVPLSCGTAALHMAVKLAGVRRGDRVFCSDMTFAATLSPVV